jgi:3-oxoacyl-[acyl-carrier-protein] synthase II
VYPNTVYNAAGGQVAMHVGAVGPASTVTTGHAAGAGAICYSFDLASANQADGMLAIAADTITDTVVDAFRDLGLVAQAPPAAGSTSGFALSEAGIAINLERLSAAQARGAAIYGEMLGYGVTCDATRGGRLDAEGTGLERAMQLALERAGVKADDVAAVWASASGHAFADGAERAALSRVFGDGVKIITPKFLFGEPLGAGGSLNAALALHGWRQGDSAHSPAGPVVVNSLSLGGTNISIVLAPFGG